MRAPTVPRRCVRPWKPFRQASSKPATVSACRICRSCGELSFPPLSNSLIAMVKDTSLAANITVTEMFMVTQRIVARTHEPLALYIEVGLIYLLFSTVLTKLQGIGEKKLSTYQKKGE